MTPLTVEQLEPRDCPSAFVAPGVPLTYGGGPDGVLTNIVANNVYMAGFAGNAADMDFYTRAILSGPYAAEMDSAFVGQGAPSLGSASFGTSLTLTNQPSLLDDSTYDLDTKSPTYGTTAFQRTLLQQIQAGNLPVEDGHQLYTVFLAPGQTLTGPGGIVSGKDFNGYHDSFLFQGHRYFYAVIAPQTADPGNAYYVDSHEWAEARTDASVGLGWADRTFGQETADDHQRDTVKFALIAANGTQYPVALLDAPDGSMIGTPAVPPSPPSPPPTPQPPPSNPQQVQADLFALAVAEFDTLEFALWSVEVRPLSPSLADVLAADSLAAAQAVEGNPEAGTAAGHAAELFGASVFLQLNTPGATP